MDLELMTKVLSKKYTQDEVYKMIYEPDAPATAPAELNMMELYLKIKAGVLKPIDLYKLLYPGRSDTAGQLTTPRNLVVNLRITSVNCCQTLNL